MGLPDSTGDLSGVIVSQISLTDTRGPRCTAGRLHVVPQTGKRIRPGLMNNFICICGLLLAGLLVPQASSSRASNSEADTSSGHRPGATTHHKGERANRNARPRILRGNASWYGRRFEGKKTASGTTFHANGHTAAAANIPLGSTAKVTNLKNGRSARVKVTDRGPMVPGRVVDVSRGTAQQLGMTEKGVTPVKVTVVKPPPPKTEATTSESDKTESVTETKPGKSPQ